MTVIAVEKQQWVYFKALLIFSAMKNSIVFFFTRASLNNGMHTTAYKHILYVQNLELCNDWY